MLPNDEGLIDFHVLPASSERYIPSPKEIFPRMSHSPVPTYSIEGSEGAIAIAPIDDAVNVVSEIENHDSPASSVFHMPPPVAPK